MALREECRKGLSGRRFGFAVGYVVVLQEPLKKGLPKEADVVHQFRSLFEEATAKVCDLLPGGGR